MKCDCKDYTLVDLDLYNMVVKYYCAVCNKFYEEEIKLEDVGEETL